MAVVYSLRMEGEAVKESVVCGHHIHKEVLRSVYGQEFQCGNSQSMSGPGMANGTGKRVYEKQCHF